MRNVRAGKAAAWMMLGVAHAALATPGEEQQRKVWDDVGQAAKKGPVDVPLLDEAVLHVPAGQVFVPQPQADRLLNLFGEPGGHPGMPGLLLPRAPDATWHVPVSFHRSGYIRDDDATTWDADAMLVRLRDAAEAQERGRLKSGLRGVESVGWLEPPRYDAASRRLAWATTSRPAGATPDAPSAVEYDTLALGRDGYFAMTIATSRKEFDALGPVADRPLAAIEFLPGKRYTDFDAKSDRVARFGLASLVVADAVASRPGLAARAAAFLARSGQWFLIGAGLFAAAAVMALVRLRRTAAAHRAFANTVAEPPRGA